MKTLIISILFISMLSAQESELYTPVNIQNAFTNKTRSIDGLPGTEYWQNRADYKIDVEINPQNGLVIGSEEIIYFNNSPDSLRELYIHLFMNIYKKGNSREYVVDYSDENEGVIIDSLSINGKSVSDSAIKYIHNDFILNLETPLLTGQRINLSIAWNYYINKKSHNRTGQVDSTSWFVAYFFPRIAVYDDIDGWNNFKYSGTTEFYNDFGDIDVSITLPRNFIGWATGMLQNPNDVLTKKYADRFSAALTSDKIIHIIDSTESTSKHISQANEKNIWRFKADYVNDFAFAISDHYLWDASSLIVDKESKKRVLIDAAYNKDSKDFYQVAQIARQSIDYMSNEIPGVPFPFPNETVFNGLDQMEYPMMVNNISLDDTVDWVKLTSHEIFHSYFPFYMGINESKYAWMDEGFASFGDYQIVSELLSPEVADFYYLESYRANAGFEADVPIIINSKYITRPMYNYNAYAKTAVFLFILKDFLGKDLFAQTLREFMRRWNGKHPLPYDFFNTFNNVSGQNLNWLIKPWFFEFGYVDLAIKDVKIKSKEIEIVIRKKGHYPAPVHIEILYKDGSRQNVKKTAYVWKGENQSITISVPVKGTIKEILLKHRLVPDPDVSNNIFKIE